ncbi:hypothetical protein Hanom_Chr13g01202891 [Helianthus anomalus]
MLCLLSRAPITKAVVPATVRPAPASSPVTHDTHNPHPSLIRFFGTQPQPQPTPPFSSRFSVTHPHHHLGSLFSGNEYKRGREGGGRNRGGTTEREREATTETFFRRRFTGDSSVMMTMLKMVTRCR